MPGAIHANECSPLYKLPSVQKVVSDHIERATKARQANPDLPYDVARNLDLLTERVTGALRKDYVDNPRQPGELEAKRGAAADAALGLGLDALIGCFPQYKNFYSSVVEPQQKRKALANTPLESGKVAPRSEISKDTKASQPQSCSPIFDNEIARGIATSVTNDLVRDFERMNWRKPDFIGAVGEIKNNLYRKMYPILLESSDHARADRIIKEILGLKIDSAKICFPDFAEAVDKISAEWNVLEAERERKKAEEAASAERERQRIAAREQEKRDQQERAEAEAKTPRGILQRAYEDYVYVSLCRQERQGYAMVYISEPEMEEARRNVKAIENNITADVFDIDKAKLWDQASKIKIQLGDDYRNWAFTYSNATGDIQRAACQFALRSLKSKLNELKPETAQMKKDF